MGRCHVIERASRWVGTNRSNKLEQTGKLCNGKKKYTKNNNFQLYISFPFLFFLRGTSENCWGLVKPDAALRCRKIQLNRFGNSSRIIPRDLIGNSSRIIPRDYSGTECSKTERDVICTLCHKRVFQSNYKTRYSYTTQVKGNER